MHREAHYWYSPHLGREMGVVVHDYHGDADECAIEEQDAERFAIPRKRTIALDAWRADACAIEENEVVLVRRDRD